MKRVIAVFAVLLLTVTLLPTSVSAAEPETRVVSILEGAVEFNGNYYKLIETNLNWDCAKAYCESIGGHLATITSKEEDDVCFSIWEKSGQKQCWLGATDSEEEGNWQWITGEKWSYTNWPPTEPNGGKRENCLQYNHGSTYTAWNDCSYSETYYFLCEWEKEDIAQVNKTHRYVISSNEVLDGAVCYNGNMYKLFKMDMTWEDARAYCASVGGQLATVTSAAEDAVCMRLLRDAQLGDCWLGAQKSPSTDNEWSWVNGETWNYTNWHSSEPNSREKEISLQYYILDNGTLRWDDVPSSQKQTFICEWHDRCVSESGELAFHQYGNAVKIENATCTVTEKWRRECESCQIQYIQENGMLPHDCEERVAGINAIIPPVSMESICVECGYSEKQYLDWSNLVIVAAIFIVVFITYMVFFFIPREHLY